MGFGAKPRWVGNEGEALPPYSPELAVSECSHHERGFGSKTVVCQRDNHIIYRCLFSLFCQEIYHSKKTLCGIIIPARIEGKNYYPAVIFCYIMIYKIVSDCGGVFAHVIFFIFIIRAVLPVGIEYCTLFAYGEVTVVFLKGLLIAKGQDDDSAVV